MNGWNLHAITHLERKNDMNQTSMIICKMLIYRGVEWLIGGLGFESGYTPK